VDARQSAPGGLALVEEFLRTRNEIASASDLDRWRAERGLPGRVSEETLTRAVRLREALRSLMFANNGGPVDPAAVRLVNAEIKVGALRPTIQPDGSSVAVRWAGGGGVLAAVLAEVVGAIADGSWSRMKACAADDCRYAFYDHTRNRSGRWCDVAGCGANARMRAYRRRLAAGA
jgi:predicted RNA-binding Zn ribbon-like protein